MKSTFLVIPLFRLLLLSATARSYEIWSVYFDELSPDVRAPTDKTEIRGRYLREQFFDLPFANTRHVFEIATYVNAATQQHIVRMELTLCEPLQISQQQQQPGQHLPRDSTRLDPRDNRTWTCLQKIVTQRSPLVCNETILRFPPEVGLPLGGEQDVGEEQKLLLLIEYRKDYRFMGDNSGFDLYLTDGAMPIEAGIMAIGVAPDARFFIPPNVTKWTTKGTCYTSCFEKKLEQSPLRVVGLFPDTGHRLLQEMTVEIDAHHKEKQQIFAWGGGRSVDISDGLIIERLNEINVRCVYNISTNQTVLGGLGADQENCVVWMHYYPRLDTPTACLSGYTTATLMSLLDLNELSLSFNPLQDEGEIIESEIRKRDERGTWSTKKLTRSKFIREQGKQRAQCGWERDITTSDAMFSNDRMISEMTNNSPALIDVRLMRRRRHRAHRFLLPSSIFWR